MFTVIWTVISLPVVILCGLIGVGLVYHLAPATGERWRRVTPDAVLALALWLARGAYGSTGNTSATTPPPTALSAA
jgi:uncharacterized BrkB/YihY/UPF0761 family membrane protein